MKITSADFVPELVFQAVKITSADSVGQRYTKLYKEPCQEELCKDVCEELYKELLMGVPELFSNR